MSNHRSALLLLTAGFLLSACGPAATSSSSPSESSSDSVVTSLSEQTSLSSSESKEVPSVESISSSEEESSSVSSSSSSSSSSTSEEVDDKRVLRVLYHNDANTQNDLAIYIWADGLSGTQYDWDGKYDDNFSYIDISLDEEPYKGFCDESIWIIVKPKATWAGQSADTQILFSELEFSPKDGVNRADAYCCEGPGGSIEVYDDAKGALGNKFSTFDVSSDLTAFTYTATAQPEFLNFYVYDASFYAYNDKVRNNHRHDYLKLTKVKPEQNGTITLKELGEDSFDPHKSYVITGAFGDNIAKVRTKTVDLKPLFDTKDFIEKYTYSGHDLGCVYNAEEKSTTFKVWAPTSARVEAIAYACPTPRTINKGDTYHYSNDNIIARIPLEDLGHGVWGGRYDAKDLNGCGYIYRLYRDGGYVDAVDPYAHASGANSKRGAIIDFSMTDPENFDTSLKKLPKLNAPNELSVYEVHIRDLTSHESWNGSEKKGTYKAFIEKGTTYQGYSTGYDHIKEFSPKAVQLLPVFDQDNDERTYTRRTEAGEELVEPAYNWGYNPQLYAVPEGSYASDPYRPEVRVKEYKELIKQFADDGIRVIMDVVYNHVASVTTNPLNAVVPGYYFQYDELGFLKDYTGCGNTTASSRVMMANFMVDTICWWAKEYGVKGFRYDLMGAIDYQAMRMVKDALYEIDPEIVVYGEPWSTAGTNVDGVYKTLKDNGKGSVGAFNNGGRDGLKGDTSYGNITPSYGFMNTGIDHMNANVKKEAAASFLGWNPYGDDWSHNDPIHNSNQNPAQTVNYVSCHDNYTLFDQLNWTLRGDNSKADIGTDVTADFARSGAVATMAATLLSQGIGFVQGGDEFFRTKVMYKDDPLLDEMKESYKPWSEEKKWTEGDGMEMSSGNWLVRNSYKYGDKVNAFDYTLLSTYHDKYLKVKEAMGLRNDMMGSIFGKSQSEISSGKATIWGDIAEGKNPNDPITAAYFRDDKANRNYYMALSGREGTGEYDNIPINNIGVGECTVKVLYSSNDYHKKDQTMDCTSTLGARDFELLLCYVIS